MKPTDLILPITKSRKPKKFNMSSHIAGKRNFRRGRIFGIISQINVLLIECAADGGTIKHAPDTQKLRALLEAAVNSADTALKLKLKSNSQGE